MKTIVVRTFLLWSIVSIQGLAQDTDTYPLAKHGGRYLFNNYLPPAPSSTPWAPDWSPDGNWFAVGMSGSIWKVELSSGAAFELTYNKKYHGSPDWSPDGKWIIYTADDGGQTIQLEILNTDDLPPSLGPFAS